MPVYENENDGSRVVDLGLGDIAVCGGRSAESTLPYDDELIFVEHGRAALAIGAQLTELVGQSTSDIGAAVRIVFGNLDSLEVVLERLHALRDGMLAAGARSSLIEKHEPGLGIGYLKITEGAVVEACPDLAQGVVPSAEAVEYLLPIGSPGMLAPMPFGGVVSGVAAAVGSVAYEARSLDDRTGQLLGVVEGVDFDACAAKASAQFGVPRGRLILKQVTA